MESSGNIHCAIKVAPTRNNTTEKSFVLEVARIIRVSVEKSFHVLSICRFRLKGGKMGPRRTGEGALGELSSSVFFLGYLRPSALEWCRETLPCFRRWRSFKRRAALVGGPRASSRAR